MEGFLSEFKKRVRRRQIKIAVVGLGYVGLPLAIEFAEKKFPVLGIEIDKDRLQQIRQKESYITDVPTAQLRRVLSSGYFSASADFSALSDADVIIICVPTPLKRKYHPDISYIKQAIRSIARHIKKRGLIILESTTYPGTSEEIIVPLLERYGLRYAEDFYLCFSPERIDPGNKKYPVHKIPKIVGGIDQTATAMARMVYAKVIEKVVPVSSARVAEVAKLLENTFRLVNIGLVDELAMMAHKMRIDIWEVIEAAKTKPFGFMPFFPGPGVGGHCLDRNEPVYVRENNALKTMPISDVVGYVRNKNNQDDIEVLSFDPLARRSVFKKVTAASCRPYFGRMLDIATEDGRHLKVTDLHPLFIYDKHHWRLKYARDLQAGDCLPVCLRLPYLSKRNNKSMTIDLLEEILRKGQHLIAKIRVKPLNFSWRVYAKEIKALLRSDPEAGIPAFCWDYLSENVLPLKYFYALEKSVNIDRRRVKLVTGRGPSYSEMPAQIVMDEDFCRLIGYYLSEGCYTKDKSARIRFSFNRAEKECIQDVANILQKLGIRTSVYESKNYQSSCIKVSSNLFGFLIHDVLGCGNNCFNMKMPDEVFGMSRDNKRALLSGLFRGDACVEHFFGKWRYRKNEKQFLHRVNTANISYFTSSKQLFQQVIMLLHDLSIVPTFKKRKFSLSIFGYGQLEFFKDCFAGKKQEIILRYLESNRNRPRNKTFQRHGTFATVRVKDIVISEGHNIVYSLETIKPHAFVTSYGITVHNCIPKDPLYLYWKARHHGFKSRFIKLASDVISAMPGYIVMRVEELLKKRGISLTKAKVLVIGATYKKNIKDLRKSPAVDIIDILQRNKIKVAYHDPLIPYLKFNHINLKSIKLDARHLEKFDGIIIATDHTAIDYALILKKSKLIFDTRNVYSGIKNRKVVKL